MGQTVPPNFLNLNCLPCVSLITFLSVEDKQQSQECIYPDNLIKIHKYISVSLKHKEKKMFPKDDR